MLNEWDWKNSESEFKPGIKLNPNYATGRHWYAEWLLYNRKFEEAFREISAAVELDPLSQGILKDKGIHFYYTGQYDEAIEMAQKTLDVDPGFVPVHRLLSLCYQAKGWYEKAIAENQVWGTLTGNVIKTDIALAHLYAAAGRGQEALAIVNRIEPHQLGSNDYRGMALVFAALEDKESAIDWLEKSFEKHEESLCSLNIDPKLYILRHENRFRALVKKLGLGTS
jgi:tetratricopeptide (TPR) repeat protein